MSNFKEQLKVVQKEVRQIETQQKRNQKRYEQHDGAELVLDLRKRHDVIVFGGGPAPTNVRSVASVSKSKDFDLLIENNERFDRILFFRQTALSQATLEKAVELLDPNGLLCFFGEDEAQQQAFVESIGDLYPQADIWTSESNMGPVVMTNAYRQAWTGRLN